MNKLEFQDKKIQKIMHRQFKFSIIYKITPLSTQRKGWSTWQEEESALLAYKKDKDRRKGKGWGGGGIYSDPCHAGCDFEEEDELILTFQIILVQFILCIIQNRLRQNS